MFASRMKSYCWWSLSIYPPMQHKRSWYWQRLANRGRAPSLKSHQPKLRERIESHSIEAIGILLYESRFAKPNLASRKDIAEFIEQAAAETPDHKFRQRFLLTEWDQIMDAWQIDSADAYANVSRLGRKTKIPKKQQAILWSIFEKVREKLSSQSL